MMNSICRSNTSSLASVSFIKKGGVTEREVNAVGKCYEASLFSPPELGQAPNEGPNQINNPFGFFSPFGMMPQQPQRAMGQDKPQTDDPLALLSELGVVGVQTPPPFDLAHLNMPHRKCMD